MPAYALFHSCRSLVVRHSASNVCTLHPDRHGRRESAHAAAIFGLQAARVECVAYPADLRLGRVDLVERDDIEANRGRLPCGVPHEQVTRRLNDAPALVRVDAVDGRAERAATARSDFDDDELLVVAAHEIDLAEPATVAACEDFETVLLE